ncbi:MAG: YchF/TatD family DNA exonuclease [Ignavibacteriaceae bacterium]|nr:YchF/TatD family DNA exonuclease [Ignavibacteriaceae bacterium]
MLIDTHAHLFYPDFINDLDEVIDRARGKNIGAIIVPATNLASCEQVVKLCEKYDIVYGAVGIHPHDTAEWDESYIVNIEEFAKERKIVAIGEIGLDYYYDFSPKDKQISAFRSQLDLAADINLPVIVHNRMSDDDTLEILSSYCGKGLKGHLHCYNAPLEHAIKYISMGYYISFTGNITFKKADDLRHILRSVSIDNLLLETDSPFMTPAPHRGKRNEPSNVMLVAEKIAEIKGMAMQEVIDRTSYNAFRLYGINGGEGGKYTYKLYDALYINITNRCNANCVFCSRKTDPSIKDYDLGLKKSEEPDSSVYINEIGDPAQYKEIVFCGYGEPTIRWDVVKEIAAYVKQEGGRTRLNTNGHGSYINKKNIASEMKGLIDEVSVSLNTISRSQYAELMGIDQEMFDVMIEFTKQVRDSGIEVTMTIVDLPEVDAEKAKKFTEEEMKVKFRVRSYF